MSENSKAFETESLGLAAYLKMRGIEMLDYDRNGSKIRFVFNDEAENCKKIQIDFLNSECKRFDSEVRDLKYLLNK